MARYFSGAKTTVEEVKDISIFKMKEWEFFDNPLRSGSFTWGKGARETSVGYSFNLEKKELRLNYSFRDSPDDPQAKQDYVVRLSATRCNYGGVRYWLHCPKCSKRVGKLYLGGKYIFACRECWNLTYSICNASGWERLAGSCMNYPEIEKEHAKIRTYSYKGKMTKRYERLLKNEYKFAHALHCMAEDSKKMMDRINKIKVD